MVITLGVNVSVSLGLSMISSSVVVVSPGEIKLVSLGLAIVLPLGVAVGTIPLSEDVLIGVIGVILVEGT